MGLFKSKYEKELDILLERVEMNCSNNYKDAAQENFRLFEEKYKAYVSSGALKPKQQEVYKLKLDSYRDKLKGYTHKEQKPFWT